MTITPDQIEAMTEARFAGQSIEEVAAEFNVSRATVVRNTPRGLRSERTTTLSGPYDGLPRGKSPLPALPRALSGTRGHRRRRSF